MKVRISDGSYGFGKTWTLECYGKAFWLGQDVKVCSRLLGMSPSQVVQKIGTNEIESESGNRKLARLIVKTAGITRSNVNKLESWSLAVE